MEIPEDVRVLEGKELYREADKLCVEKFGFDLRLREIMRPGNDVITESLLAKQTAPEIARFAGDFIWERCKETNRLETRIRTLEAKLQAHGIDA